MFDLLYSPSFEYLTTDQKKAIHAIKTKGFEDEKVMLYLLF